MTKNKYENKITEKKIQQILVKYHEECYLPIVLITGSKSNDIAISLSKWYSEKFSNISFSIKNSNYNYNECLISEAFKKLNKGDIIIINEMNSVYYSKGINKTSIEFLKFCDSMRKMNLGAIFITKHSKVSYDDIDNYIINIYVNCNTNEILEDT